MASVWTNAQFLDGAAIKGPALGLRIAAGNVPNFVDLATGGYGGMIQDALNSTQTPTMANFATLASVLAGCATRVKADACDELFAAATGRDGKAPTDTLERCGLDRPQRRVQAGARLRAAGRILSGAARQAAARHAVPALSRASRRAPGCCRSSSPAAVTRAAPR